ncbi:MAG TPA: protoporphyrinogen oxidase [Candidatus Binatia bacterium]|nr:protoporphyrinogen oxidase [Candidatus Binatia bacterium]
MSPRRVVVIGGGIAGLAAAHRLVEGGHAVTLLEADTRLGGSVGTEHADGFLIERGADAFITDKPWALALCERLGITESLIGTQPGERRTHVVHDGKLHALPEGFLLLAPTALGPLLRSSLFSWPGKLRMALDVVLPARGDTTDESLASFVRRRLGREALDRVADGLVGGIYTADPERLSLAATMPRFLAMEREHGSVIRGLRASSGAVSGSGARYGLFATFRDGMGSFVDAVAGRLPDVRLGAAVEALTPVAARWRVHAVGETLDADAVIVTTPAPIAGHLLAPLDAVLGRELADVAYASSATVTLGFRTSDVPHALPGFGFVVPFSEHRALLACTFASRKFAGRAPEGHELIRAFVGGARRPDMAVLDDDALVATVRDELRVLLGIAAAPVLVRTQRYVQAMPQYAVGHLDRVAAIDAHMATLPGLALAGAAYRGVGIPDCVRSGEAAADAVAGLP